MDYGAMSDEEINHLVFENIFIFDDGCNISLAEVWGAGIPYCSSWTDTGPILKNHEMSLNHINGRWAASISLRKKYQPKSFCFIDSNPLRAICIAFLMMKGGE